MRLIQTARQGEPLLADLIGSTFAIGNMEGCGVGKLVPIRSLSRIAVLEDRPKFDPAVDDIFSHSFEHLVVSGVHRPFSSCKSSWRW